MKLPGLPDPTSFLPLATRAVVALESIATGLKALAAGQVSTLDPAFRLHVRAGCELVLDSKTTAWCNSHNIGMPILSNETCCCGPDGTPGCGMCAEGKHHYCVLVGAR